MNRRIVAAVVLVFLVVILLAVATPILPGTWQAGPVASLLSARLQRDVSVETAHLAWFPSPRLSAHRLQVPDQRGEHLWHLSSLELHLRWADLWSGKPVVDRLILSKGQLKRLPLEQPDAPIAGVDLPASVGFSSLMNLHWPDMTETLIPDFLRRHQVEHLIVEDLSLILPGHVDTAGTDFDINTNEEADTDTTTVKRAKSQGARLQINGAASTVDPASRTYLLIEGELADRELSMKADLPWLHHLLHGFPPGAGVEQATLDMRWGESVVQWRASSDRVGRWHDISAELSVDMTEAEPWQSLIWPGAGMSPRQLQIHADVSRARQAWHIELNRALWGETRVVGDLLLDTRESPYRFSAEVESERLHLDELGMPMTLSLADWLIRPTGLQHWHRLSERWGHGQLQVHLGRADGLTPPLGSLSFTLLRDEQASRVQLDGLQFGTGLIQGTVALDVNEERFITESDLQLKHLGIDAAGQPAADKEAAEAWLAARVQASSRSPADAMSASQSSTDAQIQALVAGGDVLRIVTGLAGPAPLDLLGDADAAADPVICSYMDVGSDRDRWTLSALAMRLPGRMALGVGQGSLDGMEMDLMLELHALDADDDARVQAREYSGSLSELQVRDSSPLLGRDTTEALLAEMVVPAAALLPWLGADSDVASASCAGLTGTLP